LGSEGWEIFVGGGIREDERFVRVVTGGNGQDKENISLHRLSKLFHSISEMENPPTSVFKLDE
jgi:hypothetical protein